VRLPVSQRQDRPVQGLVYVLWDRFDGGLFEFWKVSGMTKAVSRAIGLWMCAVLFATPRADARQSPSAPLPSKPVGRADTAMFAPSPDCLACHNNLVAPTGEDVSIGASWRGTIMANAARDKSHPRTQLH
jgi:hypothetical protein